MKTIVIILLGPLVYFISSCKEDFECKNENTVPIPQFMKDFFYYKQGTWWVYKNIKTNTYDSMWLSQNSTHNSRGGDGDFGSKDKCYDYTMMGIDHIGKAGFMKWDLASAIVDNNNRFCFTIYGQNPVTTVNWGLTLFFTNNILETSGSHPSVYKDSIVIQNKRYKDLIEVKGSGHIIYWLFAKEAGLIKYIDADSNQWELFNHVSVQ